VRRIASIAIAGLAAIAAAAPAGAAAPRVTNMVVFRDGHAVVRSVAAAASSVRVGGRSCAVGAATPLAALVRARPGKLALKDYASCSKRAADGGGLFVNAIGADRNKGSDGWVYKVGTKLGVAGAADPAGPFGRGRLKGSPRVAWFYCRYTTKDGGCQHTLSLSIVKAEPGAVTVRVRRYSDQGKAAAAAGATVRSGNASAVAGSDGVTRLALAAGRHVLFAEQAGRIRSFPQAVTLP
jgi:hypothetical protein